MVSTVTLRPFNISHQMVGSTQQAGQSSETASLPQSPFQHSTYSSIPHSAVALRFGIRLSDIVKSSQAELGIGKSQESIPIEQYVDDVITDPKLARNPHQLDWDMICSQGMQTVIKRGQEIRTYNFFSHPTDGATPIGGNEEFLNGVATYFEQSSRDANVRKKILMMVGPKGSGKSMVARRIQDGSKHFSRTQAGATYKLVFENLPKELGYDHNRFEEDYYVSPLAVLEDSHKQVIQGEVQKTLDTQLKDILHHLSSEDSTTKEKAKLELETHYPIDIREKRLPLGSKQVLDKLKKYYYEQAKKDQKDPGKISDADILHKIYTQHVRAQRFFIEDQHGAAKINARELRDMTAEEMTGDVDYSKLGKLDKGDIRILNLARGGIFGAAGGNLEVIEMLKLSKGHLLPFLNLAEEKEANPTGESFSLPVDLAILGHTNPPEFNAYKSDPNLSPLFDRMYVIKAPYLLEEQPIEKLIKNSFAKWNVKLAPGTTELLARYIQMTALKPIPGRKEDDVEQYREKALAYSGKKPKTNITEEDVAEWYKHGIAAQEGMSGLSNRFTQVLVPAICSLPEAKHTGIVDMTMVIPFLDDAINHKQNTELNIADIPQDDARKLLNLVKQDYEQQVVQDVTSALKASKEIMVQYFVRYLSNALAANNGDKVKTRSGTLAAPDEQFMRDVEEKIGIPKNPIGQDPSAQAKAFRQQIVSSNIITGEIKFDKTKRDLTGNFASILEKEPKLEKALAEIAALDAKNTIDPAVLEVQNPNNEEQDQINLLLKRMAEKGYNEVMAHRALNVWKSKMTTSKAK